MTAQARRQSGYGMLEVLISLLIILIGLLGLAGLISRSQQAEMESYQRAQALLLLQDMVDRINANRKVAHCYTTALATATSQTADMYLGVGSTLDPACSVSATAPAPLQQAACKRTPCEITDDQRETAVNDMTAWNDVLNGAAESTGGSNVGAMIGARGCVVQVADDTYMVSVAWQGLSATYAPPDGLNCAKGLYGDDDALRRVVSVTLRIADLSGT